LLALSGLLVIDNDEPAALSRYRSVLVLTDRILVSGHPDHWTRFARGEAFVAQNDAAAALTEFSQSIATDPPPGDVRSELGQLQLLQQVGWHTEITTRAIQLLEQAISSDPSDKMD
jgi:predicted Zn-dependent protease